MGKFLTVCWISLVGIVNRELAFMEENERFPDTRSAIGSVWWSSSGNNRNELPRVASNISCCLTLPEKGWTYPLSFEA
jgi:hypothetical protein